MPIFPNRRSAAGMTPKWMGYVGVEDVDAKAEELKAAGGAVHRGPEDIPGVGRFAVRGGSRMARAFYLFKGVRRAAARGCRSARRAPIGWNELHAGDGPRRRSTFYSGLFGWTKDQAIPMGPMGTYQLFANGGPAIGGMMTKMPDQPAPTLVLLLQRGCDRRRGRARDRGAGGEGGARSVRGAGRPVGRALRRPSGRQVRNVRAMVVAFCSGRP